MEDTRAPLGLSRDTVSVVAYDARWPALFQAEAARLAAAAARGGLPPLVFEHIGSTAVPALAAKPILDVMAGHAPGADAQPYLAVLVAVGYELRGEQGIPDRQLLVLGPETDRTHHLNLVTIDGAFWRDHLAFRERLRAEPDLLVAYAALKRELAARHAGDRAAYTAGKITFIASALRHAERAAAS
jgi:GrpB-like predicted nucleotidyltransferase (UPF0157 family)